MINVLICTQDDIAALAHLNHMLIEDEKAENDMTISELEQRMSDFLSSEYKAFFFVADGKRVGYALVNTARFPLYLRQFFICREDRRRGYGKTAFYALLNCLQVNEIDIDVYAWNQEGVSFWKSLGFFERCHNLRFKK